MPYRLSLISLMGGLRCVEELPMMKPMKGLGFWIKLNSATQTVTTSLVAISSSKR